MYNKNTRQLTFPPESRRSAMRNVRHYERDELHAFVNEITRACSHRSLQRPSANARIGSTGLCATNRKKRSHRPHGHFLHCRVFSYGTFVIFSSSLRVPLICLASCSPLQPVPTTNASIVRSMSDTPRRISTMLSKMKVLVLPQVDISQRSTRLVATSPIRQGRSPRLLRQKDPLPDWR